MASTTRMTFYCRINNGMMSKINNPQQYQAKGLNSCLMMFTRLSSTTPTTTYLDKQSISIGLRSKSTDRRGLVLKSKAEEEYADAPTAAADKTEQGGDVISSSNGSVAAEKPAVKVVEEELSRATLLWRAAKIPMYAVALMPVTVGSAAAYWQSGVFSWGRYFGMMACFIIINAWIKLSNDVYDYDTGADKDKKESVVNLFGRRDAICYFAWSLLAIGFAGYSWIALKAKSALSLVYLASSVFVFYLYQCPPFRMSYYGVGEPLAFWSYGPVSIIGFYLLHSRGSELPVTSSVAWLSILVGLTTALILFCSHFHQIEGDRAAGKMSPLVRLGTEKASHVVKWSVMGLYLLLFALGYAQALPFACIALGTMTIPVGVSLVNYVRNNHSNKSKIFMAKYYVVRLHTALGMALSAGLVIARIYVPQAI